jgi:hypothetical protein
MPKTKITRGVSWPNPDLLEAARERATSLGMSFSHYINQLVRRDLGWNGVFSVPAIPRAPSGENMHTSNVAVGNTASVRQSITKRSR